MAVTDCGGSLEGLLEVLFSLNGRFGVCGRAEQEICGLDVLVRACATERLKCGEEVWKVRMRWVGWVAEDENDVDGCQDGEVAVRVIAGGFVETG